MTKSEPMNPKQTEGKSYFDLPESEQKEIMNNAAKASDEAQQKLMKTEEQVCTCHCHKRYHRRGNCCVLENCLHCTVRVNQEWNHVITITPDAAKILGVTPLLDTEPSKSVGQVLRPIKGDTDNGNLTKTNDNLNGNTEVFGVYEIWGNLLDASTDGNITIGDAYRMKSSLKEDIKKLLKNKESSTLQVVKEKVKELHEYNDPYYKDRIYVKRDDVLKLIDENKTTLSLKEKLERLPGIAVATDGGGEILISRKDALELIEA